MSYVKPSLVDSEVLAAASAYATRVGGDLRATSAQPHPPYPSPHNPMLRYLIEGANALLREGVDPETVIMQAAVHAWYEGNIEGREQQSRSDKPTD